MGRREAGKTYAATKLAETMLYAGLQIVALDPVGVWYGLRVGADGKSNGFDIPIFGGLKGDIPLEAGAGALIADLVVDRAISAVLDISMFRKGERQRFATDFAEQLFHRKKKQRSPLMVFLEESQLFIPQRLFKGEERMLGAFEDIGKLGRNYGIGLTLIGQRPQSVNKDVLNQTEALFAMQISGAQERKALREWIVEKLGPGQTSLVDELPELHQGVAFLWSPSWLRRLEKVRILQKRTYNASATPKAGTKVVDPKPLTESELAQVREDMKATIERAKASDPKELHRQIAELRKQIAKPPAETKVQIKEKRVEVKVPIFTDKQFEQFLKKFGAVVDACDKITKALGAASQVRSPETSVLTRKLSKTDLDSIALIRGGGSQHRSPEPRTATPRRAVATNGEVPKVKAGGRRMLAALASYPQGLTRIQLGTLARIKHKSGTFGEYLSTLRTAGFIAGSDTLQITDSGVAYLGEVPDQPQTTEEIVAQYSSKLKRGARAMLDELVRIYPAEITRVDLADRVGMELSGTFGEYLSKLRSNGLIHVDGALLRASDTLFPNVPA